MLKLFLLWSLISHVAFADLKAVSTDDLIRLKREAERRLSLIQTEQDPRADLKKVLSQILNGQPAQPMRIA